MFLSLSPSLPPSLKSINMSLGECFGGKKREERKLCTMFSCGGNARLGRGGREPCVNLFTCTTLSITFSEAHYFKGTGPCGRVPRRLVQMKSPALVQGFTAARVTQRISFKFVCPSVFLAGPSAGPGQLTCRVSLWSPAQHDSCPSVHRA